MSHLDDGLLNALLDNELDDAERRAAESHMAACPECRRQFEEARGFAGEADRLVALVEVPPGRRPVSSPETRPEGSPVWRRARWSALAWAATVVVAAGLGWFASDLRYAATPADVGNEALGRQSAVGETKPTETPPQPAAAPAPSEGKGLASKTEARQSQERFDRPPTPRNVAPGVAAEDALKDQDSAPRVSGRIAVRGERDEAARLNAPAAASRADAAPREAPVAGLAAAKKALAQDLRSVTMEEAVRTLAGSIRLVDGLEPRRILTGSGTILPGGDPAQSMVRVVYEDPPGRELWLDQQRPATEDEQAFRARAGNLILGDTVVTSVPGGLHGVRWIDQHGFRLALTGFLPGDSLRALMARVH